MMDFEQVESTEMAALRKAAADARKTGLDARDRLIEETKAEHEDEVNTKGDSAKKMAEDLAPPGLRESPGAVKIPWSHLTAPNAFPARSI